MPSGFVYRTLLTDPTTVQPQLINDVTPGTRHLRIRKPTHLIYHNRPSNNASAASYKLGEACIISWDILKDELLESLVCCTHDCVEAHAVLRWGVTSFIGYNCMLYAS